MVNSQKGVLLIALLNGFLFLNVCRADEPEKAKPIRKAGDYKLFDGKVIIKITFKGDFVGYDVQNDKGAGRHQPPYENKKESDWCVKKDSLWFIYPLSATAVWIFDGDNVLQWIEFPDKGIIVHGGPGATDKDWEKILETVPKEVFNELPERIKALKKKDK